MPRTNAQDLVGQWMTTEPQLPDPNEMLIVNLDRLVNETTLAGSANYAYAGDRGGGQQYALTVTVAASGVSARGELVAEFDQLFRPLPTHKTRSIDANPRLSADNDSVEVGFRRSTGEQVNWKLTRASLKRGPTSVAHVMNWVQFCAWAHDQSIHLRRYVYRGHKRNSYPLRTAFHRTGRTDLLRYLNEDLQELRYRISAITQRRFEPLRLDDQLELMSLGQHHGYPTPFLDWTESPFIAAFFAFADNALHSHETANEVMISVLQCDASFLQPHPQPQVLSDPRYMVGPVRPGALHNPRAIPQQSVFTFSNIVEVDTFLNQIATMRAQPLLTLINIPFAERQKALLDLRAMGITDASMFPGVDGTCRDLAQLQFG